MVLGYVGKAIGWPLYAWGEMLYHLTDLCTIAKMDISIQKQKALF